MTISRVFFNSLAGYALSRLQFRGRSVVFGLFIAVMTVPSLVLMIPRFLLIKELGMFDTYFGMILPCSWTRRESSSSPGRGPELHTLTTGVGALVSGQLGSGNQFP